ncbi:GDP-mannose 3,5-epimerase 1 [Luminiphilus syltensis NOR5-1B]|uniref:GDP-mannose 3,5-epimerase 1 n=1 Tax=Luminiphilus syltensis NOR5-1B TaxID=565045 RepID=B8KYL4_9GAMM|nr:NAD-dependent epimerase/dehydratase family protein [Luminiphilus syltensis]EED35371.1 GDP-mannose 3,5-epimerase 1 [Luminiphilus syltensis NOR5-1B]
MKAETETLKRAVVCGAGGFIGHHLVNRLKSEGFWVLGVDLKYPEFSHSVADSFIVGDLRDPSLYDKLLSSEIDHVYQLAADMGGAGYLFTGDNDADVMHNSALINLNVLQACVQHGVQRVFYSSSACVYPTYNQLDPDNPNCKEATVYPAEPDSEYGWEKLFAERLYESFSRNYGLETRVARFHNIYGPEGTWCGGKEKAPAALCRKIAAAMNGGAIEIWGDGRQTRSFLYVAECVEAVRRLMESDCREPVNVGSDRMISINELAATVMRISGKTLKINRIDGPQGVRGRNSDNTLIEARLGWRPGTDLEAGLRSTYAWILDQVTQQLTNPEMPSC